VSKYLRTHSASRPCECWRPRQTSGMQINSSPISLLFVLQDDPLFGDTACAQKNGGKRGGQRGEKEKREGGVKKNRPPGGPPRTLGSRRVYVDRGGGTRHVHVHARTHLHTHTHVHIFCTNTHTHTHMQIMFPRWRKEIVKGHLAIVELDIATLSTSSALVKCRCFNTSFIFSAVVCGSLSFCMKYASMYESQTASRCCCPPNARCCPMTSTSPLNISMPWCLVLFKCSCTVASLLLNFCLQMVHWLRHLVEVSDFFSQDSNPSCIIEVSPLQPFKTSHRCFPWYFSTIFVMKLPSGFPPPFPPPPLRCFLAWGGEVETLDVEVGREGGGLGLKWEFRSVGYANHGTEPPVGPLGAGVKPRPFCQGGFGMLFAAGMCE
jgi:hypothetical protein